MPVLGRRTVMDKSRFSIAQISAILHQEESGAPVPVVTRGLGISEKTS